MAIPVALSGHFLSAWVIREFCNLMISQHQDACGPTNAGLWFQWPRVRIPPPTPTKATFPRSYPLVLISRIFGA